MNSRQDRALTSSPHQQPGKPSLDRADIVIIGNGIAGLTTAIEARRLAPDKRIVIVTNQIHPTINTPALKQFAIGKLVREQLLAYPAGTERSERIHVVTAHVEQIHAHNKYVTLNGGRGFGYGSLLIATGSTPQGLPATLPGRDFDGVLTLHRLQDYLDLRRRIPEVSEAVVIGGGVHAIETVMGLQHWGIRVHWLIRSATFMRNMLDKEASDMVFNRIRRTGTTIYTETEVAGIVGRVGVVAGVITNHQQMIPCQMVLSCTGTQPVCSLAANATIPIRHKHGIIVDDKLRSSVRDIFAAGDVAALKNPQTGAYEPRAQWYAAVSQGKIAGAMLADKPELARQPFGTPWHATHLGDLSMLTVGDPLSTSEGVVTLTDTSQGGYRRMTLLDDRLIGYLSLGMTQPDSLSIKRIIDEGHSVSQFTKALLKGNLDARKYLSEQRSRVAEGMLTSQLPAIERVSNPTSQVELLPVTGNYSPIPPISDTNLPSTDEWDRNLVAQKAQDASLLNDQGEHSSSEDLPPYEEEFNPFTGNLPVIREPAAHASSGQLYDDLFEEVSSFTGNLPANPGRLLSNATRFSSSPTTTRSGRGQLPNANWLNDEVDSFTGNLPFVPKIVESTSMPVSEKRQKTSGLFSYALPEDQKNPTRQNREEVVQTENGTGQHRSAHNLWSYTNKHKSVKAERGR